MQLTLIRRWRSGDATLGELAVDGTFACYTLEDPVRAGDIFLTKIPGRTAIPAGTYRVLLTPSRRFGRELPLLVGVPNFAGVRIHAGNTAADTAGCILVGRTRRPGAARIGESRLALETLLSRIRAAREAGDGCRIEIRDELSAAGGERGIGEPESR